MLEVTASSLDDIVIGPSSYRLDDHSQHKDGKLKSMYSVQYWSGSGGSECTYLHLIGCNILVVVLHHVGEEGHVVGHSKAAWHFDWLAGEQAVGVATFGPNYGHAHPQRSGRPHRSGWVVMWSEVV